MMHVVQQHMAILRQAQQADPQQWCALQIERTDEGFHTERYLFLAAALRGNRERHLSMHALHRLTVHPFKRCPQRFMTCHQMGERPLQPRAVQCTFHRQHARHVVAYLCAFQLLQNQHPPLGWRDRIIHPALYRLYRRIRILRQPFDRLRQLTYRRRFEDRLQRHLHIPFLVHPRDQRHRPQRMAAALEEVVPRANPFHAENVLPQLGQPSFHRRDWRFVRHTCRPLLRLRQRFAVELAIGRQRQVLQRHEGGRHHVRRQLPLQRRLHLSSRFSFLACCRRDVCAQIQAAIPILSRHHRCFADGRFLQDRRFDLSKLDPIPPDLHLLVDSPQILDIAVRQPSCPITRFI
ncbi:hypothetical protein PAECIP111893_02585 [Paenibacillus plantiphilus]|uniref:Uncharacterized protein n=1 Tax=Paenibacillus plantiphilus TaxID=2905650 RepID=A0ABM9C7V8_9BACL|nr:hypothetical protein PAECIP111893_02585 [Paenibacillus plantiphilus]